MGSIPFAFSIHQFVSSVGADAGFAALIGLAILVLLYFAQARETASLREQAYEWAQRVQQLEARLTAMARQAEAAAAQPAQAAQPAHAAAGHLTAVGASRSPQPVAAGAMAMAPGPPAGVAAPALAAATRMIPLPVPAAAPAATATAAPPVAPVGPAPATAAGANGNRSGNGSGDMGTGRQAAVQTPPRPAGVPRRSLIVPPEPKPRWGAGRVVAGLLVALAIAGAVVVVLIVTSNKSANHGAAKAATNPAAALERTPASINPSSVTVAVLNGTSTFGLAHTVAHTLQADGYREGDATIATAADQTRTRTVVAYLPGHRAAALRVASTLKLGPSSVQPVDASTRQVACPAGSACTATVVVTVGSDLAGSQ